MPADLPTLEQRERARALCLFHRDIGAQKPFEPPCQCVKIAAALAAAAGEGAVMRMLKANERAAGYAEGHRAGEEQMREEAAKDADLIHMGPEDYTGLIAKRIRNLPIRGPKKGEG